MLNFISGVWNILAQTCIKFLEKTYCCNIIGWIIIGVWWLLNRPIWTWLMMLTVQCIVYRVVTSKYLLSFVRSSASLIPLIWVQKRNSTLQMGFHNVIQYQLFNIMSRMTFCSDSEKVITGHADPVSFYCIFTLPYTYMSILSAEWHYFMKLPVSYFWF